MLNERLRKSAKWVYLFLAVVFAVSFVIAGVGTGGPSVADLIQDNNGGDQQNSVDTAPTSIKDAEQATKDRPDDPQAWLGLAAVQRTNGDTVGAVASADKAVQLAPEDADVNESAAEIYAARAAEDQQKANLIFQRYQELAQSASLPDYVVPGAANALDPLSKAADSAAQTELSGLLDQAQPFQDSASAAFKKASDRLVIVTKARPEDAGLWFQLGAMASNAGETAVAIKAYDEFLKLAPGDPLAEEVQAQLLQLDPSRASTASTDTGATAATGTDTAATGTDTAVTGTDTAATTGADTGTSTSP
jgi:cytochrome c-type biogenesis protein CcmH/NrfG